MQKLVKKTLHYETIMPVEAYHPEDDTWQDEINNFFLGVGVVSLFLPTPFNAAGGTVATLGALANTIAHDEQAMETLNQAAFAEEEAHRLAGETIVQAAQETNEAIMEGFIDWSSDIDYDDPIVQEYGE